MLRGFRKVFLGIMICVGGLLSQHWEVVAQDALSPVVQLVSYENVFGKYYEAKGWGSASIINDKGLLLTNSHVVDDGYGNVQDAFSVCVTSQDSQAPKCHYTATLIARDKQKDIALLKIDGLDVFGQDVEFQKFSALSIDFSYVPKTQDAVEAVGYPWVGADTLTRTKGVVAGTTTYNDAQYIKTDALIAGGNSGGPLLSTKGKIVGVNTFLIGGVGSLGYALVMSEAKEFLMQYMSTTPKSSSGTFARYMSLVQTANANGLIQDKVFDVAFGARYRIQDYVPSQLLSVTLKEPNDRQVDSFALNFILTPDLSNSDKLFYYLESAELYDREYQKLVEHTYQGMKWYEIQYKQDATDGSFGGERYYITQPNSKSLLVLSMSVPGFDTDSESSVDQSVLDVLNSIQLNTIASDISFSLKEPSIQLLHTPLWKSNDYQGVATAYLGNLHDTLHVTIHSARELGNSTLDALYKAETEYVPTQQKSMFVLQGYDGYAYCLDKNPRSNFIYYDQREDEFGNNLTMALCSYVIAYPNATKPDYFISFDLFVETSRLEKLRPVFQKILEYLVVLPKKGASKFPSFALSSVTSVYSNLLNQHKSFEAVLNQLVEYKILPGDHAIDLSQAMTWREYIPLYVHMVYGVNLNEGNVTVGKRTTSLQTLAEELSISLDSYVDQDLLYTFSHVLAKWFAGLDVSADSQETTYLYSQLQDQGSYKVIYDALQDLNYSVYGSKKIWFDEIGIDPVSYTMTKDWFFSPTRGLISEKLYTTMPLRFDATQYLEQPRYALMLEAQKCYATSQQNNSDCMSRLANYFDDLLQFNVVTWGEAISYNMYEMDLSLFDASLKERKAGGSD